MIVWSGLPQKSGFFFHTSVPLSEVCSTLGFSYSDLLNLPAPTTATIGVCKIWYPNGVLTVKDSTTACAVQQPYFSNVTCSTACGANCLQCTSSSVCTNCINAQYLRSDGQCVAATACGTGYYAPSSTQASGRQCLGLIVYLLQI